jgi:aspartate ammonia-lyase
VQPGSSIMPGKVNPSMAEMLSMVCFQVVGFDTAISWAAGAGDLDLNVMTPLIAQDLCEGTTILANAVRAFTDLCVRGITADRARCERYGRESVGMATVLNRVVGYARAAKIAQRAVADGTSLADAARGQVSDDELRALDDPREATGPALPSTGGGHGGTEEPRA